MAPPGGAAEAHGQELRKLGRVRRRADYLQVYRRGRRRSGNLVALHFHPNQAGEPRLGITVSRKVGNSVARHRVKRRIVEIYRRSPVRAALAAWDIVVHVKPGAAEAPFPDLERELEALLARAAGAATR